MRGKQKSEQEGGGQSKEKPVTEWAGMTDWVVALRERNPGVSFEDKRWGRNDRLGSGDGEQRERQKKEREKRLPKTEWAGMTEMEKQRKGDRKQVQRQPGTEWAGMTD